MVPTPNIVSYLLSFILVRRQHTSVVKPLALGGLNTPQLLFYNQNFKKHPKSGYGFLKNFTTSEQLVLTYRTNCSLGCKINIIIIIIIEISDILSLQFSYIATLLLISVSLFLLSLPIAEAQRFPHATHVNHSLFLYFFFFFPLHCVAFSPNQKF